MPTLRIVPLLSCLVVTACGVSAPASDTTVPAGAAAATVVDSAAPAVALDPGVVRAARQAPGVTKMKLRVDADGKLVKQSVYHGDGSRIADPVHALAAAKFPGSKERRYETEWYAEHGEVHEVEVETKDGKHCEAAAKPDGTELYLECQIDEAALPDPVKKAIAAALPGGKVLEAETKTGPNVDHFTIEVELGGAEYYLIISPDGELQQKLRRIPAVVEVPVD